MLGKEGGNKPLLQREIRLQRRVHKRLKEGLHRLLVAGLLSAASPALGGEIVGRASVIDGDTLDIHGQRIRLEGIDAPESRQSCTDKATGAQVRCGQQAAFWLSDFIGARPVACVESGTDRYKRVLARCHVQGQDIGAAMVRAGWALAFVRYSREYEADEARASASSAGMWQWSFVPPWDWRKGVR